MKYNNKNFMSVCIGTLFMLNSVLTYASPAQDPVHVECTELPISSLEKRTAQTKLSELDKDLELTGIKKITDIADILEDYGLPFNELSGHLKPYEKKLKEILGSRLIFAVVGDETDKTEKLFRIGLCSNMDELKNLLFLAARHASTNTFSCVFHQCIQTYLSKPSQALQGCFYRASFAQQKQRAAKRLVNASYPDGRPLLETAVCDRRVDIAKMLLDAGAKIDTSIMDKAEEYGNADMIALLAQYN